MLQLFSSSAMESADDSKGLKPAKTGAAAFKEGQEGYGCEIFCSYFKKKLDE